MSVSCSKDPDVFPDSQKPAQPGIIECVCPSAEITEGESVLFKDLTEDAASRKWLFTDGTPSESVEADQEVIFNGDGDKKVVLEVTFTNGTKDRKEMIVKVIAKPIELEDIDGRISAAGLTPMGCASIGQEITFSISHLKGQADHFEWTFEGGNPEVSTEASPRVSFSARDREMNVTCKMSRTVDGAVKEVSAKMPVGNLPLRHAYPDKDYDAVSFECAKIGSWVSYHPDIHADSVFSIAEGGACGTAHSLKLDVVKIREAFQTASKQLANVQIFPRDSWASNAAEIKSGQTYEVSMWFRREKDGNLGPQIALGFQVFASLADWMGDTGLAELGHEAIFPNAEVGGWRDIFGTEFKPCAQTPLISSAAMIKGGKGEEGKDWYHYTTTFTAIADGMNAYPFFNVNPAWYDALYIDEVEINLVEE